MEQMPFKNSHNSPLSPKYSQLSPILGSDTQLNKHISDYQVHSSPRKNPTLSLMGYLSLAAHQNSKMLQEITHKTQSSHCQLWAQKEQTSPAL
jgi:hypothetical protein